MRKLTILAAAMATATLSAPALAADDAGHWQVKLLATGVLPDGKITKTRTDLIGLPVLILPATVTLKYHFDAGPIRPYVGAGPALFMIFGEKPGATARTLGAAKMHMSEELGIALQGGVDIPVNSSGMGVSFDAKKYFISTTLHVKSAAGAEVLTTKHKLDPWVISGGVYLRF